MSTLLTITWLIPTITALLILFIPKDNHMGVKWLCLFSTALNLALVIYLTIAFQASVAEIGTGADGSQIKLHWTQVVQWIPMMNIEYRIGVDGLSILMMLLTSLIIFCGVLASWGVKEQAKEFFILLMVLVAGVFGVFISFDLFTFFVFYEVAVLPMYMLIGIWGTGNKEYAAMKLTLMLVAGSSLILGGMMGLYYASGLDTFNMLELAKPGLYSASFQQWAFPVLFIGFGVLGALFPFHTWSPDGHASAPTAVSMLHAGVLMKLGGYGCLRVAMYILPEGCMYWKDLFLVLVTFNVVYGAWGAIKQTDLKYITAYSSVSHCGFVLFGLMALTFIGVQGAMLQMISHGLMTGLFFALIGMIYGRTHTRIVNDMGGLLKNMPFLGVSFIIAGLAGLGLPGLSGFVAEATIFVGSFANTGMLNRVCTFLAILSIIITAIYVLRAANAMLNGPLDEKYAHLTDATFVERIPVILLLIALFGMGIAPGWIIKLMEGAVAPMVNNILRSVV